MDPFSFPFLLPVFRFEFQLSNELLPRKSRPGFSTIISSELPLSPADECRPETLGALLLSIRRTSSGSTRYRHNGHVECASSQVSTHSTWKACLHLGRSRKTSSGSNLFRQTAHSRPSFWPLNEENRNKGAIKT
ncbi:hypothetical protein ACJIZ3_025658 [Penstemon smallii]|uniref:Uncharacterized protein n=1 Tax=Penstemon smallii TaxID=265156 RepID=A0ABD3TVG5_9LAMI